MTITREEFEELVREYGDARSDVATCMDWGSGVASAEKRKKDAFDAIMDAIPCGEYPFEE